MAAPTLAETPPVPITVTPLAPTVVGYPSEQAPGVVLSCLGPAGPGLLLWSAAEAGAGVGGDNGRCRRGRREPSKDRSLLELVMAASRWR